MDRPESGFIAAFVAGALFGLLAGGKVAGMMRFTEETGAALDSVTFLVFGAVLLGPAFKDMSSQIALYAVLSLTIVRMLPVAISLWGTHARAPTVAFMGWFGPRGLASIVFAVIVEDAHLPHAGTIVAASYFTVGLSVLLHGLSAAPLVGRYATWYQAAAGKSPPALEGLPATTLSRSASVFTCRYSNHRGGSGLVPCASARAYHSREPGFDQGN